MKQKLPENLRRKRINIMLNSEEREMILAKAKSFGRRENLSEYIREISMNPNVFIEDMNGRKEVIEKISELLLEAREIKQFVEKMYMNINLTKEDIILLKNKIDKLSTNFDLLKKYISTVLSFSYVKKEKKKISE